MKLEQEGVECTAASEIGERNNQEDRYIIDFGAHGWLLAVMDGHAGKETAEFCKNNIVGIFAKMLEKKPQKNILQATILELHEKTKNFETGSTISLVHILPKAEIARVAMLGDSPIIIKDKEGEINISPEHNARTNLPERKYAESKGANYYERYIWVGDYGLQMTRALGDRVLRSVLNSEPETYEVELGQKSFIVVASDGVIDPGHENSKTQIDRLVKLVENGADAQKLVDNAVLRRTRDNVTAIVWQRIKL